MAKYLKSGLYYDAYINPIVADELARLADVRRYDWLTVAKDKGAYHDAVDACGNIITDEAPLDVLRYANDKNVAYCYDVIVAGTRATMYKEMIVYNNLDVAEVASRMAAAGLVDELPDEIPAVDDSDDPDDDTITTAELEALEQKAVEIVAFALDINNNNVDYDDVTVLDYDNLTLSVCQIAGEEEADGPSFDPLWDVVNKSVNHFCDGRNGLRVSYANGMTRGAIVYGADGVCITNSDDGYAFICSIFDDVKTRYNFETMSAEELATYDN